jgi:ribosomal protein RSM22 (predicted rRNA methylase)
VSRPPRIHEGLVGARALVGEPYLANPALRRQYEEEIAPRTSAALKKIFAQLQSAGQPSPRRVLDLGAGTGAAGALARQQFGPIELVSVDNVPGPGIHVADLSRTVRAPGVTGKFDLVIAAHLLNELPLGIEEQRRLVTAWCDELLADGGRLVLLEPALRETSRALLAVRDHLVSRGLFIVAPCLFQGACPALNREKDWCHDAAPAIVQGRSRVDFSYLVVAANGTPSVDPRLFRIVSDPMPEKGKLRYFACGPAGRHPLVRLHRDKSRVNRAFDDLERGDLMTADGLTAAGDGQRIGSTGMIAALASVPGSGNS